MADNHDDDLNNLDALTVLQNVADTRLDSRLNNPSTFTPGEGPMNLQTIHQGSHIGESVDGKGFGPASGVISSSPILHLVDNSTLVPPSYESTGELVYDTSSPVQIIGDTSFATNSSVGISIISSDVGESHELLELAHVSDGRPVEVAVSPYQPVAIVENSVGLSPASPAETVISHRVEQSSPHVDNVIKPASTEHQPATPQETSPEASPGVVPDILPISAPESSNSPVEPSNEVLPPLDQVSNPTPVDPTPPVIQDHEDHEDHEDHDGNSHGNDEPHSPESHGNDDHGNEGLGNGSDAPPPGHSTNQNDGEGTSPGNPGNEHQDSHENNGNGNDSDHSPTHIENDVPVAQENSNDHDVHETHDATDVIPPTPVVDSTPVSPSPVVDQPTVPEVHITDTPVVHEPPVVAVPSVPVEEPAPSIIGLTINGGNKDQALVGGLHDDHLYGGNGKDSFTDTLGNDYMDGGNGTDLFYFGDKSRDGHNWTDHVEGGNGPDTIQLDFTQGWTALDSHGHQVASSDGAHHGNVDINDVQGTIHVNDGSTIEFSHVEKLSW